MSTYRLPPSPYPGDGASRPGRNRRRTLWMWAGAGLVLVLLFLSAIAVTHYLIPDSAPSAATDQVAAAPPMGASAPERIEIPSIGVDSPVVPLGLAANGTVQVPPIAKQSPVGWYRHSPTPGENGGSVMLGHLTVGKFGNGVFYRLGELHPGSEIKVVRADGSTAVFTVTKTAEYEKADFPAQDVYGPTNTPQLRLVTCTRPAGPAGSGYLANLVDYATLTSSTA
ncbi:class F sortase [Streptomyces sp. NBC_01264]|uniref:class F sortase n=1 Tax=Streptomyces sp. NBC_01264 TaxID=2903804 RepID=UPI002254415C|nr:class F sortase [Streptomyces sp. NBC_01264]MCX4781719.1 class F sortase [Streptomyces sp. NBC_01264]